MILILPFKSAVEKVDALSDELPMENRVLEPDHDLKQMYDEGRDQYNSRGYVMHCARRAKEKGHIVLGVTGVDLFSAGLNFVFGTAQIGGRGGVISINRLGEDKILRERMVKEAVHEIGHILGLEHCPDENCVMHFSNSLSDTDRKAGWFCSSCEEEYQEEWEKIGG